MRLVALLAAAAACGGPQLKEHVADLPKHLPATLEAERPKEGDPRTVKLRIYADAAVRAAPKWKEDITDEVDYASQLLTPLLGVRLTIESVKDWARTGDPHAALAQLTALDKGDDVTWVVGWIAPNDTAARAMSELGDGEPLGHHVIVHAWAETQETDAISAGLPDLKPAERAEVLSAHKRHKQTVVLLHFLAATLGAIADTDPAWIQNPLYSPKETGFSERNRELLQLAVDERVTDGTNEAIAKKLLEAIEKEDWGGWVGPDKEQVVNRLRIVIDAKRAGKTASDIPAAAYDQVTRIRALAQQGKLDDAMAELDNVIAAYPGNGSLTQLKCELLLAPPPPPPPPPKGAPKGKPYITPPPGDKALQACGRVIELAPGDPMPHIAIAKRFLYANDLARARAELVRAEPKIANLPGGADAVWREVIALYQRMGSLTWTEDALAAAKLDKDPIAAQTAQLRHRYGVPRGAKFVRPEDETALVNQVRSVNSAIYAKQYGQAEKLIAEGEKKWPGAPGFDTSRCDMNLALGRIDVARAACAKAIAADPEESWALYLSGALAFKDPSPASTARGIEQLKKAIAVDPDLGQAWRTLAKGYLRAKDRAAYDALAADYQAKFGTPLPQ